MGNILYDQNHYDATAYESMMTFNFFAECTEALLSAGTLKLMLVKSTYNFAAGDNLAAVQAQEITATGNYGAGGPPLAGVVWAAPVLDADNVAFYSMTATFQHLVLWNSTSSKLLACWTYDDLQVLDNSSITIAWPETGILDFVDSPSEVIAGTGTFSITDAGISFNLTMPLGHGTYVIVGKPVTISGMGRIRINIEIEIDI